jgi:hypothetical protein
MIPLLLVVGNGLIVAPEQIGATGVNVGVTGGGEVMTILKGVLVQFLASLTIIVYVPAGSPVKMLLAW